MQAGGEGARYNAANASMTEAEQVPAMAWELVVTNAVFIRDSGRFALVIGDWINVGRTTFTVDWVNPLTSLGERVGERLPGPDLNLWHPPTYDSYCGRGVRDPALVAISEGSLADVK